MSEKLTNPLWKSIVTWVKANKRLIIIVLFAILCLIALIKFAPEKQSAVNLTPRSPISYVDKNKNQHNEFIQQEVDKDIIKGLVDSIGLEFKKKGQVKTVTQFVYITDTIFRELPVKVDSQCNFLVEKSDDYIDLKVVGNKSSADISLTLRDTLAYTQRTVKHLFKSNETIVDVSNKNPYSKVTEGISVTVKERKPLLSLGVGAVYNPFTQKPQYGIGVYIPVISLKTSK